MGSQLEAKEHYRKAVDLYLDFNNKIIYVLRSCSTASKDLLEKRERPESFINVASKS